RINALPCRARTTRGRLDLPRSCRRCGAVSETLSHVTQRCPATHQARIQRHDNILDFVAEELRKKGYTIEREPRYNIAPGTVIPDLVATKDGTRFCIDAHVVGPQVSLSEAYTAKRDKYRNNRLFRAALKTSGIREIHFGAITVNISGCIAQQTSSFWGKMGL